MSQFQSATVLITGAAGGFGQELTRQLLAKGSRLILTDHHTANLSTKVADLQKTLGTYSGEVIACLDVDLASATGCETLYAATRELDRAPDILINNAGMALIGKMLDIPNQGWEQMMQINLLTPMRLSNRFAADMVNRGQGHIVNISSLAGWISPPGLTAYAASKFGLRGFSDGLRQELAPYNVKVTTVYPFFSRTPLLQSPRFGTYDNQAASLPPALTTDPAKVMARTIRAVEGNRSEVFPDFFAWGGHYLQRYFPLSLRWLGATIPN